GPEGEDGEGLGREPPAVARGGEDGAPVAVEDRERRSDAAAEEAAHLVAAELAERRAVPGDQVPLARGEGVEVAAGLVGRERLRPEQGVGEVAERLLPLEEGVRLVLDLEEADGLGAGSGVECGGAADQEADNNVGKRPACPSNQFVQRGRPAGRMGHQAANWDHWGRTCERLEGGCDGTGGERGGGVRPRKHAPSSPRITRGEGLERTAHGRSAQGWDPLTAR